VLITTLCAALAFVPAQENRPPILPPGQKQVLVEPGGQPPVWPVTLEVQVSKPVYRKGETVEITARLVNQGGKPIWIAKPIHDGNPAAFAGGELYRNGRLLHFDGEESMFRGGVIVGYRVTEDRFVQVEGGDSMVAYWAKFSKRVDLPGGAPVSKLTLGKAKRIDLAPGEYEFRVTYRFSRTHPDIWERSKIEFEGISERIFDVATQGTVTGKAKFTVKG